MQILILSLSLSLSLSHTHTHTHTHTEPEGQTCRENGIILRIHPGAWGLDGNAGYYFPSETEQDDMLTCLVFSAGWPSFGWIGKYTSLPFFSLIPLPWVNF